MTEICYTDMGEAEEQVRLLGGFYTGVRMVDPVEKEVVFSVQERPDRASRCYEIWDTGSICQNCISMRAILEGRPMHKVGGNKQGAFAVTAVPVKVCARPMTVEIILDVTGALCYDTGERCENPSEVVVDAYRHVADLLTKDPLTGLYNRRFVTERLPAALNRAMREKQPLSILFADIDRFKKINDVYGHGAGDQVLKGVAELMQENVRHKDDWVARYGGEEFLICLFGADEKRAAAVAERIRMAVMGKAFPLEDGEIFVTCSLGLQTYHPRNGSMDAEELIEMADKKLYLAKEEGRNRARW
jgi:two-component system cell cycle response regulator